MKTKLIILVSALSLLCVMRSEAQTTTTVTDYVPKGTNYLFECSRITFMGGEQKTTIGSTMLVLRERENPVTIEWKDSIVQGETYLYGCDRFTTDTEFSDTIYGWERDTIRTFVLKVREPKRDTIYQTLYDTICSGQKYLFGCEIIDTDNIFSTTDTTIIEATDWIASDTMLTLQLAVLPVYVDMITNPAVEECDSVTLNGKVYYNDITITDTIADISGCRSIMKYHGIVHHSAKTDTVITICESELPYEWHDGKSIEEAGTFTDTLNTIVGCDSVVTLTLKVQKANDSVDRVSICAKDLSSFRWEGHDNIAIAGAGTYYDTIRSSILGCDSIRYTLVLTVNEPTTGDTTATVCSSELPYTWHGIEMESAGDTTITLTNAVDCDSIVTLTLIVDTCATRGEKSVTGYVCSGVEYYGRLTPHIITGPTSWTDSVRVEVTKNNFVDSIYHYDIAPYILTLPVIPDSGIIVRCGKAIDITKANSIVQDHITATGEAYAPNVVITWQWFDNNAWQDLPGTTAIRGGVNEVQVRCAVTTDCGSTDTTLTVPVVEPAPENDITMDNMPASSMYGNRLLIVNKHAIDSIYGWDIQPADVVWYSMTGAAPDVAVDESVHTGLYYTADEAFAGKYYARITHQSVNASDCGGTLRTVVLTCEKEADSLSPQLIPTVAHPAEQMRLLNLNAAAITEIRVYNTSGELQSSYTSAEATEFLFRAAHSAGYYLVDVVTEDSKVTLRYIVK